MSERDVYYVRVKPYNKQRGHLIRRTVIMDRLWTGGDGLTPGDIPEWVKVNGAQAAALKEYKQSDDPFSPRIFDIVTPERKAEIDAKEEEYRKAYYGLGPRPSLAALPNLTAKESDATGASDKRGQFTLEDLKGAPPPTKPVITDDDDDDSAGAIAASVPKISSVQARVSDVSGRLEAASDFPTTEDLNADGGDAAADDMPPAPVPTAVPPPKSSRKRR
jgi:hypothetical protein